LQFSNTTASHAWTASLLRIHTKDPRRHQGTRGVFLVAEASPLAIAAIAAETFLNQQKKNGSLVASLDPWCSL